MGEAENQFINEIIKLIITGVLGGLIAHYLSIQLFKSQQKLSTRHEFQLKKLEALTDINEYLHWLYTDIFRNWEKPANDKQTPEEYMFNLMNKINYWKTLFLTDQEFSKTLEKLNSLIGSSKDEFNGENQKRLGEAIEEIRAPVKKKMIEIQKSIISSK